MSNSTRRQFLKTTGLAAAGTAALAAPAVLRAQEPTRWRCQSMWSSSELTYKAFVDFCDRVKTNTNGRLVIEPFAAGAVTGVFETLDAVTAGVLQAQSTAPVYFTGKDAGLAVIGDLSFGYTHPYQAEAWFYYKGGLDMLRQAYAKYNAYPVGVSWWGVESIVSKKPITTMGDFKGSKFRTPQGIVAEIVTKLGASPIVIPGGEVFSALDKGVVDSADWATISMNQRMGFFDVAKYSIKWYHSMPVQELTVNMDAWKKLPDDVKGILLSHDARVDVGPGAARRGRRRARAARRSGRRASSRSSGPTSRWSRSATSRTRRGRSGRRRRRSRSRPTTRRSRG